MNKIELSSIPTDSALPADLYDAEGKVFARAGEVVAPYLLELSKAQQGLYVDDNWPLDTTSTPDESPEPEDHPTPSGKGTGGAQTITVRSLRAGSVLDQNIHDENGILLLRAGANVTARFLERLKARGIQRLTCKDTSSSKSDASQEQNDQPKLETPTTRQLDRDIEDASHAAEMPAPRITPAVRLELENLRNELEKGRRTYEGSVDCYARLAADAIDGKVPDRDTANGLISQFFDMIGRDDSLGALAVDIQTDPDERLFHHSVNVAILTMSTARFMGFSDAQVFEAGLGAMFHDSGMLKVPVSIRMVPRKLTRDERMRLQEHPIHSVNMLEKMKDVTPLTLMVAYQMHERCDASGYPRGRHEMFIHPLAKIAGIADSYVAGCSWRPHREARSPYRSMVEVILAKVREGLFDSTAARAFLDCLSLFPVGSYVRLSSDVNAKVLRTNQGKHTYPVVVPLSSEGVETDQELDLSKTGAIRVVAALDPPYESTNDLKNTG